MIKNFEPRLYQQTILNTAALKNTLVVLPTGMGKTNVFLMLAAQRLLQYPNSKILLIGPTRPLIDQYLQVFVEHFDLPKEKYAIFTGHVKPEKRAEIWKTAQIFFSTPQGLENDIISERINLEEVSLLGIDEAHRATGDYAYVFVAKQYYKKAKYPRIIGMTASPGSDMDKIQEVCGNLGVEAVEVRSMEDPDVKPYIQETEIEYLKVDLPPTFKIIQKFLRLFLLSRLKKLKELGIVKHSAADTLSKRELLGMQASVRGQIAQGESSPELWSGISVLAEIMKVQHALELLETQGVVALSTYCEKMEHDAKSSKVKAVKNIIEDPDYKMASMKAKELKEEEHEHPKLVELQRLVQAHLKDDPDLKMIIFNQYRDNASDLKKTLNKIPSVKAEIFVGQQKKGETGLSQKQQKALLDEFRNGTYNVLVATSIGEEGLDIPKVDLVIFFEPIPSAIRSIQRRGRTGRHGKGKIITLITKDTRDEAYRWTAHHKERAMYRNLEKIRNTMHTKLSSNQSMNLNSFSKNHNQPESKIVVYIDHREKSSQIAKALMDFNVQIKLETLAVADYVLSKRCGVEYKTKQDFVQSIIDGRLLDQIAELKKQFERPLLILEGDEDLYSIRNIHPNAIRGMLATIAVSYAIPVLQTKDKNDTAQLLYTIAKREQEETSSNFSPHAQKKTMTIKEQQEYLVSALPSVGPKLAKELLGHFGSVDKIMNASKEDLKQVTKIGAEIATQIRTVIEQKYQELK